VWTCRSVFVEWMKEIHHLRLGIRIYVFEESQFRMKMLLQDVYSRGMSEYPCPKSIGRVHFAQPSRARIEYTRVSWGENVRLLISLADIWWYHRL
jgi:hypothetical protein